MASALCHCEKRSGTDAPAPRRTRIGEGGHMLSPPCGSCPGVADNSFNQGRPASRQLIPKSEQLSQRKSRLIRGRIMGVTYMERTIILVSF